ncbi:MAG: hypothetical protein GVY13_08285 [Alphaproteobacteria bacterium]|nr:hypothetical protein [Alphaproteobacteria bacterium]
MAEVIFYGKPGCKGNARQVRVLEAAGHSVVFRDLLSEPWTADRLLEFFGNTDAPDWFNRSAVRVKTEEIVPERLSADEAMSLILTDTALIRRPLLEVDGVRQAGWQPELIDRWIGLTSDMSPGKESCARRVSTTMRSS